MLISQVKKKHSFYKMHHRLLCLHEKVIKSYVNFSYFVKNMFFSLALDLKLRSYHLVDVVCDT